MRGLAIQFRKRLPGSLHRGRFSDDLKVVASVAYLDTQVALQLAQMLIELTAKIGKTLIVLGLQGDLVRLGVSAQERQGSLPPEAVKPD